MLEKICDNGGGAFYCYVPLSFGGYGYGEK